MRLVAEHPDSLVRDQYVMRIADRCMVSADEVRRRGERSTTGPGERGRRVGMDTGARVVGPGHLTPEHQALRLLVHRPEEICDHLVAALFDDPLNRVALEALCDGEDLHSAMEASDGVVADLLGRLAVQDASDDEPRGILSRLLFLAAERAAVALEAEARLSGDLATYQPSISYLRTPDHRVTRDARRSGHRRATTTVVGGLLGGEGGCLRRSQGFQVGPGFLSMR